MQLCRAKYDSESKVPQAMLDKIAGDPLGAEEEAQARDNGWR